MRESEDWDGMALSADVRRYVEASTQQSLDERRMQIRFAAVLCRCEPWYDHGDPAPAQYGCLVHTTIMFDRLGDWL